MHFDRKNIGTIRDFWFETDRNKEEEKGADFAQYHDLRSVSTDKHGLVVVQPRKTLVNNLNEDAEEIIAHFKKNTKYEVRRATKEGCYSKFIIGSEVCSHEDILKRIDSAHAQMFTDKGKQSKSEFPVMIAAARANMLAVSIGFLADGREGAYHVYIVGNGIARLLHSISVFREVETNDDKNAIGRLNRFLHYDDMINLKKSGYQTYDWGGYSEEEQLKSISEFKAAFGGDIIDVYTAIYATSMIGKLTSGVIKKFKFKGN